jgi:hypothetical protein
VSESEPADKTEDRHRFRRTLVSVLLVQVITLLLLAWMQHHFSH